MKIAVTVHPNSKKPRVEKDSIGTLHVWVNAPPLEGKANKATTKILTDFFKIKINQIILLSGEKSKYKIFEIIKN